MIDNKYQLIEKIGLGGSSLVYKATDIDGNDYAIKILRKDKEYNNRQGAQMICKEHQILSELHGHSNLIQSYEVNPNGVLEVDGRSEECIYQVTELATNGSLSNIVRNTGPLEEELARFFITQILYAVLHLHSKEYAHLDIKLENIFLDEYFNIKLGDLGSSAHVGSNDGFFDHRRGTPLYMAPEVKSLEPGEEYDAFSSDMYSLGITLFVMLTGEFPTPSDLGHSFETKESDEMEDCTSAPKLDQQKIKRFSHLSSEVIELIQEMTEENDVGRPQVQDILESEWLQKPFSEDICEMAFQEMEARKNFLLEECQRHSFKGIF
ncbi:unnamed protein product [Moneuplotes crassus]|uniref:Protein kinase domain-containing protein n=1 Tax=Euplotes crassus TaxID=5936 RepID=A0AAD2D6S7_EUPCR|nr:unnamed protein product [Moneuplotes crassus]